MAIYYNGKKVNPLVSFIGAVLAAAALICFILLLLPLIGGVLLFGIICAGALVVYGLWYRWRYGDPVRKMNQRFAEAMKAQVDASSGDEGGGARSGGRFRVARRDVVKTGVRRTSRIEDAEVVGEVRRRRSGS